MPKRILIIEDDPDILELLNLILNEEGYEVVLSENGEASYHLTEIMPDLVLLDINLKNSGQNGDAICSRIKNHPKTKRLPVVILSAERDLAAISRSCGADGWISKPFDILKLIRRVKALLYPS
ncbi:response regulator [Mucilaginibacter sp. UR6-1]|uniref:response regulator n=1 Tax=Mucilaginibacter sp. UR6-1 TaxID=1435643 RepID=UPI001E2831DB|nr:response regulator [Mucilaginibacter sp. UR6-1]MCC8408227.1 response regulator [Mucilaginibacter sp. UR6-1]